MSDKKSALSFGDKEEAPDDLPSAPQKEKQATARDASRTCEKCGSTEVRINNAYDGSRAHCVCGHSWSLSMFAVPYTPDGLMSRGITKRTLVEPDWELAYEDLDDWPEDNQ